MQLKFKSLDTGNTNFVSWLKQFKDVDTSNCLLLEVDTEKKMFISKVFTIDKFLVKFSQISFEDAGYKLDCILDNNGKKVKSIDSRVLVGIFMIFSKFVDITDAFNGSEHEMNITFDENTEKETVVLQAQNILFSSKTLKIRAKMGNLSEFNLNLTDDVFFSKVYVMNTPVTVNVSKEVLKNIISVSGLLQTDSSQEEMVFYTKNEDGVLKMYVKDNHGSSDAGYDYYLGDCDGNVESTSEKIIYRNKFIMVTKSIQENIKLTLGGSNEKIDQKIFIETNDQNTKNVISTIQY